METKMPPTPLTTIYKEINGSKITTDIYLPKYVPGQDKYPVLINIHGGAFMLGHSSLISLAQVTDCLDRGWIVLAPNHRLCPQVDIAEGPVRDCRDFLGWVYDDEGGLDGYLLSHCVSKGLDGDGDGEGRNEDEGKSEGKRVWQVDKQKVMAMGTSSGGFLALALGYDTPRPPRAILNFYGAVHFTHPFWTQPLPHVQEKLPPLDPSFIRRAYDEVPVPTGSGISLEGEGDQHHSRNQSNSHSDGQNQGQDQDQDQDENDSESRKESESKSPQKPNFSSPRDAFALTQIANGTVLSACYPRRDVREIDPVWRVGEGFPPTCIVHGTADRMVPGFLSRELLAVLQRKGVRCEMVDVPGEDHTFAMGMRVGSRTWEVQRRGFEFLEEVIGEGV